MNYKPYQSKIRWKLLIFIGIFTLLFHGYAFYLLKEITFTSYHSLNQNQKHLAENSLELHSGSIKQKNKDLENIFSRLMAKTVIPLDVKFDFKDLDAAALPEDLTNYDLKFSPQNQQYLREIQVGFNFDESPITLEQNTLSSLAYLEQSFDAPFDFLEETKEIELPMSEPCSKNLNVFHSCSLVDIFDSSAYASSLDQQLLSIGLKEPVLPSSDVLPFDSQDKKNEKRVLASSSDFLINVEYAPQSQGSGFVFKLSLCPKPHKLFQRIKQNIYFLIDRSHSIPLKYYQAAKDAVGQSLDFLHPDDSFNILIFDGKVTKLASKNMSACPKNIKIAKQFLQNQKHGGFFATTDLYSSLDKMTPEIVKEDEVNIAILISDGDTFINKHKQRKTLNYWSQKNNGKVSLFSLAVGKNRNIALLDLLSTFNKGFLRAAYSPESISQELLMIVQSLRSPIGKDLIVTGLPHHRDASLKIFPEQQRLPNLYENLEYVLYGTIDQASDFTLFLQGRYYDNWLDIKKSISLSRGTLRENSQLKKGLDLQRAYGEYEQYLRSGHPEFLEKAKGLLEPLNLPLAFE